MQQAHVVEEDHPGHRFRIHWFQQERSDDRIMPTWLADHGSPERIMLGAEISSHVGHGIPGEHRGVFHDDPGGFAFRMAVDDSDLVHIRTVLDLHHIV